MTYRAKEVKKGRWKGQKSRQAKSAAPRYGRWSNVLQAEDKLNEARYFLNRMKETIADNPVFKYYLSAFLSAARSVTFALQAELADRPGFRDWYADAQERMRNDARMRFFVEKRDYVIHVANVATPAKVDVRITDHVYLTDSLRIEVIQDGKVVETRDAGPPPPPRLTPDETSVEWRRYFPEYPDVDASALCEEQLEKLSGIVREAVARFS